MNPVVKKILDFAKNWLPIIVAIAAGASAFMQSLDNSKLSSDVK